MKDKVIQTAGKIWKTLGEKGEASVPQLAKAIKEAEDITNQAIGWLAREDKIKYVEKGSKKLIALVESEQQIYEIVKNQPINQRK